ncbi:hypothetical protein B2J93_8844 [Marssonina coronariae]|uniref:Uncharacterized protein n=1 Tax=Diplocarpon coronariae TaxID=2795749 RepID=A0A218ZFJ6_9HELO|nr:hypothetical protein B2J93_8844 [Marssonina coronariae]
MSNILPEGMDGRSYNGSHGKDSALQEWQRNAVESLAKSLERPNDPQTSQRKFWTRHKMDLSVLGQYIYHHALYKEEKSFESVGRDLSFKIPTALMLLKQEVQAAPDHRSVFAPGLEIEL